MRSCIVAVVLIVVSSASSAASIDYTYVERVVARKVGTAESLSPQQDAWTGGQVGVACCIALGPFTQSWEVNTYVPHPFPYGSSTTVSQDSSVSTTGIQATGATSFSRGLNPVLVGLPGCESYFDASRYIDTTTCINHGASVLRTEFTALNDTGYEFVSPTIDGDSAASASAAITLRDLGTGDILYRLSEAGAIGSLSGVLLQGHNYRLEAIAEIIPDNSSDYASTVTTAWSFGWNVTAVPVPPALALAATAFVPVAIRARRRGRC